MNTADILDFAAKSAGRNLYTMLDFVACLDAPEMASIGITRSDAEVAENAITELMRQGYKVY